MFCNGVIPWTNDEFATVYENDCRSSVTSVDLQALNELELEGLMNVESGTWDTR